MQNVINQAFGELNNIFQDEFNKIIKFHLNSRRISDPFYQITESVNKNKGPKHTHLAMFWNFCVG